jgi:hypothetical protein
LGVDVAGNEFARYVYRPHNTEDRFQVCIPQRLLIVQTLAPIGAVLAQEVVRQLLHACPRSLWPDKRASRDLSPALLEDFPGIVLVGVDLSCCSLPIS